ncbi:TonB-dependent receptor [Ponticaulis profundi]|uniref:Carboxypeptidase regulatory-like domain-containing protein n=1 Tax=Ponticaulis profundi TaxID=2665222 RepID=A0ABW1S8D7_9PROT
MKFWKTIAGGVAMSALATAIAVPAMAQVTTSAIRGTITTDEGAPVSGADIQVTHEPSGTVSTATTNASGAFSTRGLRVGGPYTISVTGGDFTPVDITDIYLNIDDNYTVPITVSGSRTLETVVVSAPALTSIQTATGPAATFSLDTLQNSPAINRDIKDIIRMDPRVYLDEGFEDAISCAGASPRFNSLTLDGGRLNDNFGLNSNGYPTERIPFSYDAIDQVAVELAPFDVEYGSFTACNINAVSKSGTNEFHGSAFIDYTSDQFTGDRVEDREYDLGAFDEYRYGFTLGGPIIKDKLFFFGAYEKFEGSNVFGFTPEGAGVSTAEYNQIIDIAEGYGYIAGGLPSAIDVEDEKILAKLDWNITDQHRASFTYNYNDGFNYSPSDSGSNRLADGNHYYERGAELNSYSASLYSDWTDNFSTDIRVSYIDLANRQNPVLGLDNFGEVQVRLDSGSTVYLGADDSRHANKLSYDLWNYKAAANYLWNDHTFTVGYEREEFEVFNLFVQEALGEWVFDSIEDFANGDFADFRYENASGTNDVNDGAASFGYEINTLYAQDEWQVSDKLNVVAGLRYDWYTSGDKPAFNQNFADNYGFGNDETMDGRDLLQPRIGFNYDFSDLVTFHGGLGLFSGGNPNVWVSNSYSNNGVTLFECRNRGRTSDCVGDGSFTNINDFTYGGGSGQPFIDVPDEMIDAVANASGQGSVNAIDPDFDIPSEWKFALGTVINYDFENKYLGDNWTFMADFLYSKTNESAIVVPIGYVQTGTAPDGRPLYGGNSNDFLLTNADDKGETFVYSAVVQKDYGNGIDWSLAYAYTDSQDTNPMTSSVAFSNFSNFATSDPVNVKTATSDYEIPHRFTARLNIEKEFVTDYATRFTLVGTANQGAPFSYTFAYNGIIEDPYRSSRQLAYIPTGANDPLISANSDADAVAELMEFINGNDYLSDNKGSIAERNGSHDDWWTKFDLRISQDLPGFRENDRSQAFLVIENLGNLINDDWGILREHGFPGNAELYSISGIENGQYVIDGFGGNPDRDSVLLDASLWEVRFGLKYEF